MQIFNVSAAMGGEAFLLQTDQGAALLDAGYSFSAAEMITNIKSHLQGQKLDYILLTHSHYDHVSGSVHCREQWPDVQVLGSAYAQKVFTRPGALATIREMNQAAFAQLGTQPYEDKTAGLTIDRAVGEGDQILIGPYSFQVLATPGHTKCSLSFYCADLDLLLLSETTGVQPNAPVVAPGYMTGYQQSLDAIQRLAALQAQQLVIPHMGLLSGAENCADFFARSHYWAVKTKDMVLNAFEAGHSKQQIIDLLTDEFYVGVMAEGQPREAFALNISYVVPMLVQECAGVAI